MYVYFAVYKNMTTSENTRMDKWLQSVGLPEEISKLLEKLGFTKVEELEKIDKDLLEQIDLKPAQRLRLKNVICNAFPNSSINKKGNFLCHVQKEQEENNPHNTNNRSDETENAATTKTTDLKELSTACTHASSETAQLSNLKPRLRRNKASKASSDCFNAVEISSASSKEPVNFMTSVRERQELETSSSKAKNNQCNTNLEHKLEQKTMRPPSPQTECPGDEDIEETKATKTMHTHTKSKTETVSVAAQDNSPVKQIANQSFGIRFLERADKLKGNQNPQIYQLRLKDLFVDKANLMRVVQIDNYFCLKSVPNKVIMVLGETGSGKSTLINAIVNYLFEVDWNDHYRFQLVDDTRDRADTTRSDENSQTDFISAYELPKTPRADYKVTIIDTPGYGDTRGIARDNQLTGQIKKFFELSETNSVTHLDTVCFVLNANATRLSGVQKYIFDSVLGIFSKDIASNISLMLTFCNEDEPPVLKSIAAYNVPYSNKFKFNNRALYYQKKANNLSNEESWFMTQQSLKIFFQKLPFFQPQSLTLTKQVLEKRFFLECQTQGLNDKINAGLALLQKLEQDRKLIEQYKQDIDANRSFKIKEKREKFVTESLSGTKQYVTNCIVCNMTCHFPCQYSNDNDKYKCIIMRPPSDWTWPPGTTKECLDGVERSVSYVNESLFQNYLTQLKCAVCKCQWDKHTNFDYRYIKVEIEEEITLQELKRKYDDAIMGHSRSQAMLIFAQKEYDDAQQGVVALINKLRECFLELENIALRPSALTTSDYIEMMIEQEKREMSPNLKKISHLEEAKKISNTLAKIRNPEGFNPLAKLNDQKSLE